MKVVCIYHFRRERPHWPGLTFPNFGQVYAVMDTVREDDSKWFVLAEIQNAFCWHGGWWAKRFRPVVDAPKTETRIMEEVV